MILGLNDILTMVGVIGVLVGPLYALLIFLIRAYSSLNREIGELRRDVEQNTRGIEGMKDSVDALMRTWSSWIQKKKS